MDRQGDPVNETGSVTTVLGDVRPSLLGVTDAHDHLLLRTPALPGLALEDPERAAEEVLAAKKSGIGTIVEMTPIGCGRRPALLRAVSQATGVHVIAATGYHRDAHYPSGHWVENASVELLSERVVSDLERGMHPDDWLDPTLPLDEARAGAIKAGASYHRVTRTEERRLVAAAIGSRLTGAAILVHSEIGTAAHDIIDLLEREGAAPERTILAHLDRNLDPDLHAEVASRGVSLEYDTVGRIKYHADSDLLSLIESMVVAGYLDRILLGLDLGRRDYFRAYGGGPGLIYLMNSFVPRLRHRIGEAATTAILVGNPARAFARSPAPKVSR